MASSGVGRAPRLLRQAGRFFAPPFGGFCARPAHTVEAVSYTHLDVYKRQAILPPHLTGAALYNDLSVSA